ncbi:MAG: hypothetical protein M1840_003616 [Geoglossum simile]|nr:MAG: hypothetical protein M1840_003616 [Geoglossum simile]
MIRLQVQLTLPSKNSLRSKMPPSTFLLQSKTIDTMKQKAQLLSITQYQAKQICLDSAALSTDTTIEIYRDRMEQILPHRRNLQVVVPFNDAWFGMWESFTALRLEVEVLKDEQRKSAARQLELENKQLKSAARQLELFAGNALVDLGRLVLKKTPQSTSHSTNRLVQLSQTITSEQLCEMEIPTKYLRILRQLPKVIERRNSAAHDTSAEFARLLLSERFRDTPAFILWRDVFPLVYERDIEEMAPDEGEMIELLTGSSPV